MILWLVGAALAGDGARDGVIIASGMVAGTWAGALGLGGAGALAGQLHCSSGFCSAGDVSPGADVLAPMLVMGTLGGLAGGGVGAGMASVGVHRRPGPAVRASILSTIAFAVVGAVAANAVQDSTAGTAIGIATIAVRS